MVARATAGDAAKKRVAAKPKPKPAATKAAGNGAHHARPDDPAEFDLTKAVAALTPEFVQCRDWGHSWRPFHASWDPQANCWRSLLRCGRCGTERERLIGKRGQILGSHYDYADGYQMRGAGHLSTTDRDSIRLASIRIIETKDRVND